MSSEQNFDLRNQSSEQRRVRRLSGSDPDHVTPNVPLRAWAGVAIPNADRNIQFSNLNAHYRGVQTNPRPTFQGSSRPRDNLPALGRSSPSPRAGLEPRRQYGNSAEGLTDGCINPGHWLSSGPLQSQYSFHLPPPPFPPTPPLPALPIAAQFARRESRAPFFGQATVLSDYSSSPATGQGSSGLGPFDPTYSFTPGGTTPQSVLPQPVHGYRLQPIQTIPPTVFPASPLFPAPPLKTKKSIWDFARRREAKEISSDPLPYRNYSPTETFLPRSFPEYLDNPYCASTNSQNIYSATGYCGPREKQDSKQNSGQLIKTKKEKTPQILIDTFQQFRLKFAKKKEPDPFGPDPATYWDQQIQVDQLGRYIKVTRKESIHTESSVTRQGDYRSYSPRFPEACVTSAPLPNSYASCKLQTDSVHSEFPLCNTDVSGTRVLEEGPSALGAEYFSQSYPDSEVTSTPAAFFGDRDKEDQKTPSFVDQELYAGQSCELSRKLGCNSPTFEDIEKIYSSKYALQEFVGKLPAEQLDSQTPRSYGRQLTYQSLFGSDPTRSILFSFDNDGQTLGANRSDNPEIPGDSRGSGGSEIETPLVRRQNNRSNTARGFYEDKPLVGRGTEIGLGIAAEAEAWRLAQDSQSRKFTELDSNGSEKAPFVTKKGKGKPEATDQTGSSEIPIRSLRTGHPTGTRKVSDLRAKFEQQSASRTPSLNKKNTPRPLLDLAIPPPNCSLSFLKTSVQHDSEDSVAPPIPRKCSRRLVARPRDPLHPDLHKYLTSGITPSGATNDDPITPANKAVYSEESKSGAYYSDSVYSQKGREEYQTPPHEHPDLRPNPLSIRKISDGEHTSSPSSAETPDNTATSNSEDPFLSNPSFLDNYLPASNHQAQMETLQVSSAIRSSTKTKAVEDARAMQTVVIESCKKAGRDPPKYVLLELIGKGSFGRVYKGKDVISTAIVAVKIIDIDESDTLNPRLADTYSEFMKEVNALKILSESKARNINHVIEALPVGKAMWMITEYCGGGSIATLMKPTPAGLNERFIVPILREVAEAVKWVHQAGIIHRDLKCANILITEEGGVQLCDFGVAGITETALDKRSTFIGTFNWMAPELFQGSSYGTEVDIWAFGSMAYEMATGLPPNAMSGVSGMDLGPYLRTHIPRLEGGPYSDGLRSIVAFCLEENPSDRPTIEAVQRHSYIYNTGAKHPASSLSDLVKAFKMWENHGGSRKSLFGVGGAQGPSEVPSTALSDDSWNFSTTAAFDLAVAQYTNAQDVINVYGSSVALSTDFQDETSRPARQQQSRPSRRRPPPEALAPLKAPLEKLFDPNTISNYEDNARTHYNQQQNPVSDLPLRDDSAQNSIRDTMIDLDAHDVPSSLSSFSDMDTIKAGRRIQDELEEEYDPGTSHDFTRPAFSDPADNPNRRTQDWKFPVMAPPASANPELSRFPATYEPQRPSVTPASGGRPALIHHPTEPISIPTQSSNNLMPSAPSSPNRMSLIDLDLSLPEPSRPSTADSTTSQEVMSANPFHLERHTTRYHPTAREPSLYVPDESASREPSLYLPDGSARSSHIHSSGNTLPDLGEISDFSASDAEGPYYDQYNGHNMHSEESAYEEAVSSQSDYEHESSNLPALRATTVSAVPVSSQTEPYTMSHFPALPPPPSVAALSGTATQAEMTAEMDRMINNLHAQLTAFRDVFEAHPRTGGH